MLNRLRALCASAALCVVSAVGLHTTGALAQATQVPSGMQCFQATTGITGMIGTTGTLIGGYGGVNGLYINIPLTGGTGSGATANITVALGGTVTNVAIVSPGTGYAISDILSATNIGGTTGFSFVVASTSINSSLAGGTVGMYVPGTLTTKSTWTTASETTLNTNPVMLDANGCAVIWGTGTYRQIVYDSLGNEVWDKLTSVNPVNPYWASTATGTPNAITVTWPGFASTDGQAVQFIAANTNTGATTLNGVSVVQNTTSGQTALTASSIVAGNTYYATYSATYSEFFLLNAGSAALPFANVVTVGADPTGTNDSSSAFATAYGQVSALGGEIIVPPGKYKISAFPTISASNVTIECAGKSGPFGGSVLEQNASSGNFITMSGQFDKIENCGFIPLQILTSGYQINMTGCFQCEVSDVAMQYGYNGISVLDGSENFITNLSERYMINANGLYFGGSSGSYGLTVNHAVFDNPWPNGTPNAGSVKTWTALTAYSSGQVVAVNNQLLQAASSGTSASGSGPTGLPPSATTPAQVFTAYIPDGSVSWFRIGAMGWWMIDDSFGYSMRINNAALLDSYGGLLIEDSKSTGSSFPQFGRFNGLETDHSYTDTVAIIAGGDMQFVNGFHCCSLIGNGMNIYASAIGNISLSNSRLAQNASDGLSILAGKAITVSNNQIVSNGLKTASYFPAVAIGAGVGNFIINGNMLGQDPITGSDVQTWGVVVAAGASDYYNVVNNICGGNNASGCVSDSGTGTHKTVSGNN